MERRVGSIQLHGFLERIRAVADKLEPRGQFRQPAPVRGGSSVRCEPHHGRLEHAIQGRVDRQFVEAARQPVGTDSVSRELSRDIQLAAQQRQVVLEESIAVG